MVSRALWQLLLVPVLSVLVPPRLAKSSCRSVTWSSFCSRSSLICARWRSRSCVEQGQVSLIYLEDGDKKTTRKGTRVDPQTRTHLFLKRGKLGSLLRLAPLQPAEKHTRSRVSTCSERDGMPKRAEKRQMPHHVPVFHANTIMTSQSTNLSRQKAMKSLGRRGS